METLQNISAKNETQEELKLQLEQLLEFVLIDLTQEILIFERKTEEAFEAIESYLKHKGFDEVKHEKLVEFLKTSDHVSMSDMSVLINHLLLVR